MEGTIWGADAFSSREAADYLGIDRQTLWARYQDWKIPVQRVGGQLVFLKGDLDHHKATYKRQANQYPRNLSEAA